MTTDTLIEQRLTAAEKAIGELQQQLAKPSQALNWLERITGSFKDEPAFEEVLEFGRAIRSADRPPEDAEEQGEVPTGHWSYQHPATAIRAGIGDADDSNRATEAGIIGFFDHQLSRANARLSHLYQSGTQFQRSGAGLRNAGAEYCETLRWSL